MHEIYFYKNANGKECPRWNTVTAEIARSSYFKAKLLPWSCQVTVTISLLSDQLEISIQRKDIKE